MLADKRRLCLYGALPLAVGLLFVALYFSEVELLQAIASPASEREFGLIENTQTLLPPAPVLLGSRFPPRRGLAWEAMPVAVLPGPVAVLPGPELLVLVPVLPLLLLLLLVTGGLVLVVLEVLLGLCQWCLLFKVMRGLLVIRLGRRGVLGVGAKKDGWTP